MIHVFFPSPPIIDTAPTPNPVPRSAPCCCCCCAVRAGTPTKLPRLGRAAVVEVVDALFDVGVVRTADRGPTKAKLVFARQARQTTALLISISRPATFGVVVEDIRRLDAWCVLCLLLCSIHLCGTVLRSALCVVSTVSPVLGAFFIICDIV